MEALDLDMVNRDPNNINSHLGTLVFNDVFGEPDGTHSFGFCWKAAAGCFECWKHLVYKYLTTCFGICIAAEWGVEFAYLAFYHIWYISPMIKVYEINCGQCKRIYDVCIKCCIEPCCEALGGIFVNFKKG